MIFHISPTFLRIGEGYYPFYREISWCSGTRPTHHKSDKAGRPKTKTLRSSEAMDVMAIDLLPSFHGKSFQADSFINDRIVERKDEEVAIGIDLLVFF